MAEPSPATTRRQPPPTGPHPESGWRWFAWAGFFLPVPDSLEPYKLTGSGFSGELALADEDRPRIQLLWDTPKPKPGRYKPDKPVRKHLAQGYARGRAPEPTPVAHPRFAPFYHTFDEERGIDRYAGYSAASHRVVDLVYVRATSREDRDFRERVLPQLGDHPTDEPKRWAFFGNSVVTPAGFVLMSSQVNLGDMSIRLIQGRREHNAPEVLVRQIYPAELALKRQPLTAWMGQLALAEKKTYRAKWRGWGADRQLIAEAIATKRGKGAATDLILRRRLRPFLWRRPWRARMWLIHDEAMNRLIALRVAVRGQGHDEMLTELVAGLHWAQSPDDAA